MRATSPANFIILDLITLTITLNRWIQLRSTNYKFETGSRKVVPNIFRRCVKTNNVWHSIVCYCWQSNAGWIQRNINSTVINWLTVDTGSVLSKSADARHKKGIMYWLISKWDQHIPLVLQTRIAHCNSC